MKTKNPTHDQVRRVQTAAGSVMPFISVRQEIAAEDELAHGQDGAEQAVEHGRLPPDEDVVLQHQRRAAEQRR